MINSLLRAGLNSLETKVRNVLEDLKGSVERVTRTSFDPTKENALEEAVAEHVPTAPLKAD
jgi:uncharacterized membrane protein